jgi:hypothetical protein
MCPDFRHKKVARTWNFIRKIRVICGQSRLSSVAGGANRLRLAKHGIATLRQSVALYFLPRMAGFPG